MNFFGRLRLAIFSLLGRGTPPPPPPSPSPPVNPGNGKAVFVAELIAAHNAFRAKWGKGTLAPHPALQRSSEAHARDMAAHRRLDHNGRDGSEPSDRILRAGYRYSLEGENIAEGQTSVAAVMTAWENHPPHLVNLIDGRFIHIGAACVYDAGGNPYWCVDFGAPLS